MLKINSQFKIKEIKLVKCLEFLIKKKKCLKFSMNKYWYEVKLNKMNTGCIQEFGILFYLFLVVK